MAQAKTVYYEGKKSTWYPNGLIKVGGHRNWRNNNPGNIKAGPFTKSHGAIGSDGTFAVFNSMEDGYKAQGSLLQSGSYKNLSMHDAIYRWAPPSENDSAGYVRYVASKTGIDPNKKMSDMTPEEVDKVVHAMAAREGIKNGSGDVIEGADVNGNQASGGKKIDDPFAGSGSGGGTPGSGTGEDPCLDSNGNSDDPNDPGNPGGKGGMLDKLAQIEGNGSYTQGANNPYSSASGRYQFMASTAESELIATGLAKNKAEASTLWHECKSSASSHCQHVQDTIATHYSNSLMKSLPSNQRNMENLYLRYNQGKGGGDIIKRAQANGTKVTNPTIVRNMDNQAWSRPGRPYHSNGDPDIFLKGLRNYVKGRGVDPDATF
jgi:hypothetical protein